MTPTGQDMGRQLLLEYFCLDIIPEFFGSLSQQIILFCSQGHLPISFLLGKHFRKRLSLEK